MAVIVRLLLLFMIALSGQSLGFCLADPGIYSYDGFALQNFPDAPGPKIRVESFFALGDGFFVPI